MVYDGTFEGVDTYGRIIVYHEDYKNNDYDWFKWKNRIIGKPTKSFIGKKGTELLLPDEFKNGDRVKIRFTITKYHNRGTGQKGRVLDVLEMEAL
jgi:hypothetical protein